MYCRGVFIICLGFTLMICGHLQAEEVEMDRGKLLYENHCIFCHAPEVHERENRKVKSQVELSKMVIRWQHHLKLDWTFEEVSQVMRYLNRRYYKISEQP